MFTGLIEAIGTVRSSRRTSGGIRLAVETPLAAELEPGESVAIDGACLTVKTAGTDSFEADVSQETLARTTLSAARSGGRVNLERALRASDRLGGHIVTGHVDGTGRVVRQTRAGDFVEMEIEPESPLEGAILLKGSICVDGTSLTISGVGTGRFAVTLIPETLERTVLASKKAGAAVNLETDIIGKYVDEYLSRATGRGATRGASLGSLFGEGLREGG